MPRCTLAVALALTLCSASTLVAQVAVRSDEIQPGARVRITAPGIVAGRYVGTVLSRSGDTVTVGSPNSLPLALPTSRIASLEISRGKSRSEGAKRGIRWGAPIGLALGLLTIGFSDACYDCVNRSDDVGSRVAWVGVNGASGALWGAGIGALIGRERWEPFDLQHHAALELRSGGASLALRYDF
jgi:hypothetical protein